MIHVVSENARGPVWKVLPPMFRWDLTIDMDLVEEYARLKGYQHIPEALPSLSTMPLAQDLSFTLDAKLRRLLQGEGCLQAINYAFISSAFQARILGDTARLRANGLAVSDSPVRLVNPLNEELDVMRTSLLPGLVKNVLHNSRQSNSFGRLFETGFGHALGASNEGKRAYTQEARLSFAFWGEQDGLWSKDAAAPVVFSLKGAIENLMRGLGIERWHWVQLDAKTAPEFLHPSQSARLDFEGKPIGFVGTLHPSINEELKVREPTAVAEINLERLLQGQPRVQQYKPISKMPAVERDLAFLMPKDLPSTDIENEIRKAAGELLKDIRVFDVFEGGALPAGQRSVAYRLLFQAQNATLEDQKINELRDRIVGAIAQKFSVNLRA
jgi:phenylalanyl-tRNA synthetase beta chain